MKPLERILTHIQLLTRKIQSGERTFYYSRIIEQLCEVMLYRLKREAFIKWLDLSDRKFYTELLDGCFGYD